MSDTKRPDHLITVWHGKDGYAIVDAGVWRRLNEQVERLTAEVERLTAEIATLRVSDRVDLASRD